MTNTFLILFLGLSLSSPTMASFYAKTSYASRIKQGKKGLIPVKTKKYTPKKPAKKPAPPKNTTPKAPQQNPLPAALGSLRVSIINNGLPANGTIEVLEETAANLLASGNSGATLNLPVRTVRIRASLSNAQEVTPVETLVTIQEGNTVEPVISFSTARMTLSIQDGGNTSGIARVFSAGSNTLLGTMGHGGQLVLGIGTYDIKVTHQGQDRWFRNITLSSGQLRNINAQF